MTHWSALLFLFLACCATPHLYKSWDEQLGELPEMRGRKADVSFILGTPPSRCEAVAESSPMLGVMIDPKRPLILSVTPDGPADQAGLEVGDSIESVAGNATPTRRAVINEIKENARTGVPLEVQTKRGTHRVVPRIFKVEQCYWEVRAGEIHRAGGAAYVNPYSGSAGASSSDYQRFYRASCRIIEGFVAGCTSHWQM